MNKLNRRRFLRLAGAGSAIAAAGALLPAAALVTGSRNGIFRFRGVAGLPQPPLATYASYVVEGRVDLKTRSGTVTKAVFAGAPEAMSTIALPGLFRVVRVTDVQHSGEAIHIKGVIDDRSQFRRDESPSVEIVLNRSQGVGRTHFFGTEVPLRVEP